MKRLGKFTGIIYDENYDFSQCPECCLCITDEQANDEKFVNDYRVKSLVTCIGCMGCPAAERRRV